MMAYEFGPIQNAQKNIVGLAMRMTEPLPPTVDMLLEETLGEPIWTSSSGSARAWKLAEHMPDDEWRWFISAVEWRSHYIVEFEERTVTPDIADRLSKMDGADLDWEGTTAIRKLIDEYRAHHRTVVEQNEPEPAETGQGYQRLLYRTWALRDKNLKPIDRLTLFAILRYCWSADRKDIKEATIAADVGTTPRTLQRSVLPNLVKHKYIEITPHHNHASTYRILRTDLLPPYVKPKK